jgi:hypothetical protein
MSWPTAPIDRQTRIVAVAATTADHEKETTVNDFNDR